MNLNEIPDNKLVLIRWQDIVYFAKGMHPEDTIEDMAATATLEIVGRLTHTHRGIAVVQVEWPVMSHEKYDDEGEAGRSTQLIPTGCIQSVHELKIGKKLYVKETEPDGNGPRERGRNSPGPDKPIEGAELQS